MALSNGVGRLASGLQLICPQQIMISNSICALSAALAVAFLPSCADQKEFMGASVAYGFASGPLLGLLTESCAQLVPIELLGLAIGMIFTMDGTMSLLGAPIVASLEILFSDSDRPLYVVTACLSVAALLFLVTKITLTHQRHHYSSLA